MKVDALLLTFDLCIYLGLITFKKVMPNQVCKQSLICTESEEYKLPLKNNRLETRIEHVALNQYSNLSPYKRKTS